MDLTITRWRAELLSAASFMQLPTPHAELIASQTAQRLAKRGTVATPDIDVLTETITAAAARVGLSVERAGLLAMIVGERLVLIGDAEYRDPARVVASRNARIRHTYNGRNAGEIARREGVSVRTVRRIANGR